MNSQQALAFRYLPIPPLQRRPKLGGVKRTDGRIGDNQGGTCRGRSCVRRRHGDESCANGDVVATVAEFDGDFLGRLEHRLEWLDWDKCRRWQDGIVPGLRNRKSAHSFACRSHERRCGHCFLSACQQTKKPLANNFGLARCPETELGVMQKQKSPACRGFLCMA